jgi:malonyl-CoA O-methyltransferase
MLNTSLGQLAKRNLEQSLRRFRSFGRLSLLSDSKKRDSGLSSPTRALNWIRNHEGLQGGILVHSASLDAYPGLTGYLISTLLRYGEKEMAARLLRWLLCVQRVDGSYTSPDGVPHAFDAGQVLRGLLAGAELVPSALDAAQRAADYLYHQMKKDGDAGFGDRFRGTIPESVHLYVLPPLIKAADLFQMPEYKKAAERCLEYYCRHKDFLRTIHLTHFLGYELEALIDLGRSDIAVSFLDGLCDRQERDGSLLGMDGVQWVCAPGLAQIAVCWYKIGRWEAADKALDWLESQQRPTGGFYGSYGRGASYFRDVEIPWAAKFYLDAHFLRIDSFFDRNARELPSYLSKDDGRLQAILSVVKPKDQVLEVGCGKGRFLKAIHESYPDTHCTGVDISTALLQYLPEKIQAFQGLLESIPLPDNSFDVVFAVEAIEHSSNMEASVSEMIRVARPGGWVLIIDKHRSEWDRLKCPPWERWPEISLLQNLLNRGCDQVTAETVSYDGIPASDGLMFIWRGQKRSRISGTQWNEALLSPSSKRDVLHRVRYNHLSEWCQAVLLATAVKEKVLEVGSGTGEISLHLAQAGRKVTALDFSKESLEFVRNCAEELGLSIETVLANATRSLPFYENAFNCVWSSGLLEHFGPEERQNMLREQARISKDKVVSLVPNAACVAYQAGRAYQEEQGAWPYGLELPVLSMRSEFETAGLQVASEYSVGAKHALGFLPENHPLRKSLASWLEGLSSNALEKSNQGYLLVTIGFKPSQK